MNRTRIEPDDSPEPRSRFHVNMSGPDRNQTTDALLMGSWKSVEYQVNSPDGWQFYDSCEPDEILVWEFLADRVVIERTQGNPAYFALGTFSPSIFELHIRHKSHPCWRGSLDQKYRVEILSYNELWFYGLEDVFNEPKDYHYRLKVVRVDPVQ